MLHEILYILHVLGMASLIGIAMYLVIKKDNNESVRKKLSLYLMSASHTQLLTGFALFFLLLPDVNHMKLGIKMLLAIDIAVVATLYRKKIAKNEIPNQLLLLSLLITAISATMIAFLMK